MSSVARIAFSTPSISFSAAEYSRLDWTLRSCAWYFLSFSLRSASSPSALRRSSSAWVSRARSSATASTFSLNSRSTSMRSGGTVSRFFSRLADELDPGLEPVELAEQVAHRDAPEAKEPEMKKGVPVEEHPGVDRALEIRFRIRSLNLPPSLVGPPGFEPGLTGYEPVALDR